jgi:hypothetical protein
MTARTLGDILAKVRSEEPLGANNIAPFERPVFPRIVSRAEGIVAERSKSEPPVSAAESTARLIDEAYERGKREGAAAVQSEFDVKLVEQRTRHVMKLASDRHRAAVENAKAMGDRLVGALKDIEAEICQSVAAVLARFVTDAVRRQAVEDLATTLSRMVAERRPATLKVEGPGDLLDALKGALADFPLPIDYTAVAALAYDPLDQDDHGNADAIEVRVQLDERVIETQIGAWLERLRGATQ